MRARVSTFTRWNAAAEARRVSTDYLSLDQFGHEVASQEEFYESSVRDFIERCLEGSCGSIIAYGGWGSGKSYTLGTLDPQQLTLAGAGNEGAGVLPRCMQQLYDSLGPGAAIEITCVEVQGDDVVDLLDARTCPPIGRLASAAGPLASSSPTILRASVASVGSPGPGPGLPVSPGMARSPIAAASPRRKPLTLAVVRSLPEALLTLKRAVSNRQAFVTATRHSSSRTHAVFQLRWRTTAPGPLPSDGPLLGPLALTPPPSSRATYTGSSVTRPYSAPPRSGLQPTAVALGAPICTLTLVDTCSFCPLLPPKEGSVVKRSLLALSRVLSALQRRQALSLRESKLTRMLEGALDQVLVLACLGSPGDEATMQLVKMLQQGAQRDTAVRRSRRVSSSDSPRTSAAWEAASRSSLCSVSSRSLLASTLSAAAAMPLTPLRKLPPPQAQAQPQSHDRNTQLRQQQHHRVVDQPRKLSARERSYNSARGCWEQPPYTGGSRRSKILNAEPEPPPLFYSPSAPPAPAGAGADVVASPGRDVGGGAVESHAIALGSPRGRRRVGGSRTITMKGEEGQEEEEEEQVEEDEVDDAPRRRAVAIRHVALQTAPLCGAGCEVEDGAGIGAGAGPQPSTLGLPPLPASSPAAAAAPRPSGTPTTSRASRSGLRLTMDVGGEDGAFGSRTPAAASTASNAVAPAGASSGDSSVSPTTTTAAAAGSVDGGGGVDDGSPRGVTAASAAVQDAAMVSPSVPGGGRRLSSAIPHAPGSGTGTPGRRDSARLVSPREKPPSVTARAAIGLEARRSQGFSVLAGKWAPPPPPPSSYLKDDGLPIVPCLYTPRDGRTATTSASPRTAPASRGSPGVPASAAELTTPREKPGNPASTPVRTAAASPPPKTPSPAPEFGGVSPSPAVSTLAPPIATATSSPAPVRSSSPGSMSLLAAGRLANSSSRTPGHASPAASPCCTAPQSGGGSAAAVSPGCAQPLSAGRRRPGIHSGRPPIRSPPPQPQPHQPAMASAVVLASTTSAPASTAAAAAAAAVPATPPTHRATARASPRSASPAADRTVVSLAAVRPTRLASMRYGSANASHDSAHDTGMSGDGAAMSQQAAASASHGDVTTGQQQPSGGGGTTAGTPAATATTTALTKRSASSGTRCPSPLLRARRDAWLASERRSRSAHQGRVFEAGDPAPAGPGRPCRYSSRDGDRPTLSSQYKDLLVDFQAFKASERKPRRRCSPCHGAAPSPQPQQGQPEPAESATPTKILPNENHHHHQPHQQQQQPPRHQAATPAQHSAASSHASPVAAPAGIATPPAARTLSGCMKPPFNRQHSSPTDDGLLSLTAAAAVAAASPRGPPTGGAVATGARSRPGVSRPSGMYPSPRQYCSPDTLFPSVVLDISRLSTVAGALAISPRGPPGSVRGERPAGGAATYEGGSGAAAAGAASEPEGGSDSERGGGDNMLGPSSFSDLSRMLRSGSPGIAVVRHSMIAGGKASGGGSPAAAAADVAACAASVLPPAASVAATSGGAAEPVSPCSATLQAACAGVPVIVVDAQLTLEDAAPETPWATAESEEAATSATSDEELPAVSFFIHHFTPCAELEAAGSAPGPARSVVDAGATSATQLPEWVSVPQEALDGVLLEPAAATAVAAAAMAALGAGGGAQAEDVGTEAGEPFAAAAEASAAGQAVTGTADVRASTMSAGANTAAMQPPPLRRERPALATSFTVPDELVPPGPAEGSSPPGGLPPPPRPGSSWLDLVAHPRGSPPPAAEAPAAEAGQQTACAAAAAAAHDRSSVESGVLRGSCTPFAVDSEGPAAEGGPQLAPVEQLLPEDGMDAGRDLIHDVYGILVGSCRVDAAVVPGSQGSLPASSLWVHPEGDVEAGGHQADPRVAGSGAEWSSGTCSVEAAPRQPSPPPSSQAANMLLAQLAHVRPNHADLDEHSVVVVGMDSGSESEPECAGGAALELLQPEGLGGGNSGRCISISISSTGSDGGSGGNGAQACQPEPCATPAKAILATRTGVDPRALEQSPPSLPRPRSQSQSQAATPVPALEDPSERQQSLQVLCGGHTSVRERVAALEASLRTSPTPRSSETLCSPSRSRQSGAPDGLHSGGIPAHPSPLASPGATTPDDTGAPGFERRASARLRSSALSASIAAAVAALESAGSGRCAGVEQAEKGPQGDADGRRPAGPQVPGRPPPATPGTHSPSGPDATPPGEILGQVKPGSVLSPERLPPSRPAERNPAHRPLSPAAGPFRPPAPVLALSPERMPSRTAVLSAARSPVALSGLTLMPTSPGPTPGRSPGPTPGRSSAAASGRSPGPTPGRSPAAASGRSPGPTPGRSPTATPGRSTGPNSGRTPSSTPGRSPGATPGRSPGPAAGLVAPLAVGLSPERLPGRAAAVTPGLGSAGLLPVGLSPGRLSAAASARSTARSSMLSPSRIFGLSPGRTPGRSPGPTPGRVLSPAAKSAECPISTEAPLSPDQQLQLQTQQQHSPLQLQTQQQQQQQQQLRGSGNVAASWRAAAAVSASSSSSLRSCFRSSVGTPIVGVDAVATATVVAVGRPPLPSPEKTTTGAAAGAATAAAAAAATAPTGAAPAAPAAAAAGMGGGAGVSTLPMVTATSPLRGAREQPPSAAAAEQPVVHPAATTTPALALSPPGAAVGSPGISSSPQGTSAGAAALTALSIPSAAVLPAANPTAAATPGVLVPSLPLGALTARQCDGGGGPLSPHEQQVSASRGAHSDRSHSLSARLRGGKSGAACGKAAAAAEAEGGEQAAPPAAYPPGFVSWATKLFSSARKGKGPAS